MRFRIQVGVKGKESDLVSFISQIKGESIWSYRDGCWQSFIQGTPVFLNSLEEMVPGAGYYIYKNQNSEDSLQ